jgi:hypothetical protein
VSEEEEPMELSSCTPYIQLFNGNKMIFSTIKPGEIPRKYYRQELSIVFPVDLEIEGDILLRARHFKSH